MKKILYFMVASAFIGAELFSIDIRIMHLSLYRIGLLLAVFYFFIDNLLSDKSFTIKIKDRHSFIVRFYFLWALYALYSLAWVLNLTAGIKTIIFLISGLLCICIFSDVIKEEKEFRTIFNIMFIMIILHNILGWFELQTGKYFFADLSKIDRYSQFSYNKAARLPVTLFTNPNDFATLMTFGVFLSIIILLNNRNIFIKGLSSLTIISSILLILRTGSRGNLAGLLLGIAAIIMIFLFKNVNKVVLLVTLLLGLIFIIVYPPLNAKVVGVIQNTILSRFGSESMSIRSDEVRFNLIKNGFTFLVQTVGFGTGAGNIEYWMAERKIFYVAKIVNMHNWWMEILVAYGVVTFILYVFVYLLKIQTFIIGYLKSKKPFIENTSLGLFGFMVAYILSSVSSSSNIDSEWIWLLWAVIISFIGYIVRDFNKMKELE